MSKHPPPKYLFPSTVELVEQERRKEQLGRSYPLTFAGFVDELIKIGLRVLADNRNHLR